MRSHSLCREGDVLRGSGCVRVAMLVPYERELLCVGGILARRWSMEVMNHDLPLSLPSLHLRASASRRLAQHAARRGARMRPTLACEASRGEVGRVESPPSARVGHVMWSARG